jgi:SPX domain protein involved in polyphosphate accumulation
LKKAIYAPWRDHYIAYDELKGIIKVLSQHGIEAMSPNMSYKEFAPSLSVSQVQEADFQVTYEGKELSEEYFFVVLDTNLAKVSDFIKRQMKMVLQRARELEVQAAGAKEAGEEKRQKIITQSKSLGEEFLRLEKFVNVNYTGFHKILKKHDKQVSGGRERRTFLAPGVHLMSACSAMYRIGVYRCVPVCCQNTRMHVYAIAHVYTP